MSRPLRDYYKTLNKGEKTEDKLYRLFVNEVRTDDAGVIILPNVEGFHIFGKGGPGSVEIDMIVAHPQKGIFVFNVKNDQKPNLQKLKYDMEKHSNFVRLLSCYNGQSKRSTCEKFDLNRFTEVPIYNVFIHDNYYPKNIGKKINAAGNKVIVFKQPGPKNFVPLWGELVRSLPDMADTNSFDLLVARLVVLSLASNGHIHQKFASNDIQSIQVSAGNEEAWIKKQLREILIGDYDIKCELIELFKKFQPAMRRGKTKVILWTKEQLEIIATVFKALSDSKHSQAITSVRVAGTTTDSPIEGNQLRINVRGGKGTGKTMLMTFLAQMTSSHFGLQVVVCDGSAGNSKMLFSRLKHELSGLDIEFWSLPEFSQRLDRTRQSIVFIDEDPLNHIPMHKAILFGLQNNAHMCLFSSEQKSIFGSIDKNFVHYSLSYPMRFTKRINDFYSNLSRNLVLSKDSENVISMPSASLDGTNQAEVFYVHSYGASKNDSYLTKCVEVIKRLAVSLQNQSSLLVLISFLSPKVQLGIVSRLRQEEIKLSSNSYELDFGDDYLNLPEVQLESTSIINGIECGAVVVLLEAMVNKQPAKFLAEFYMAITRATTNVAIVAGDESYFTSPMDENEISDSVSIL